MIVALNKGSLSNFQENHGYSKTLDEYKSEIHQAMQAAKQPRDIKLVDGYQSFCIDELEGKHKHMNMEYKFFKRCDYESFSE